MKLLIITQVVDVNHPVLGFFHRWIEEFAKNIDHIHVIALEVGEYNLPQNVTVHSLGKEKGKNKSEIIFAFYSLIFLLRKEYDSVFVHMNPEYIVLAGWWWRLAKKKIGLWYTHKSVDLKLRTAAIFANVIFTASKESFRLSSSKLQVMGHGIDTNFFKPDQSVMRGDHFLSVGRLDPTKRHDLAIQAAAEAKSPLRIAGGGDELKRLESLADELNVAVTFLGPCTQEKLLHEYQTTKCLIHTSETGSLDKVILEALACGASVVSTSALENLPVIRVSKNPKEIGYAALQVNRAFKESHVDFVTSNHSLEALIVRLCEHVSR